MNVNTLGVYNGNLLAPLSEISVELLWSHPLVIFCFDNSHRVSCISWQGHRAVSCAQQGGWLLLLCGLSKMFWVAQRLEQTKNLISDQIPELCLLLEWHQEGAGIQMSH